MNCFERLKEGQFISFQASLGANNHSPRSKPSKPYSSIKLTILCMKMLRLLFDATICEYFLPPSSHPPTAIWYLTFGCFTRSCVKFLKPPWSMSSCVSAFCSMMQARWERRVKEEEKSFISKTCFSSLLQFKNWVIFFGYMCEFTHLWINNQILVGLRINSNERVN